ncbi:type VI secretion system protein ImpK [Geoanaerobacter pelophilus]|uniref:Type VI secretion system protein ImpK n=1 Tax=Geoanaerobacter pelophilus TaxID=60036 RepID=A0ABQ0MJX2_9BACT|nr:DotU family type IV/VI secretion system protein [Geoanaerobacter pelophilus]GAW67107.1 type VI secretion system protein ImpK [Geoanaerobacter pelophilus]
MRLIDSFMPLVAYVVDFRAACSDTPQSYRQVKEDVAQLLLQSEQGCGRQAAQGEDYDLARFAVCAWVDETLLASDWREKQLWQREQLQRLYYRTTEAGVELFERLQELGARGEVREVYYLCLALGFKGRYIGPGDEARLEHLKQENLKLLLGTPSGVPSLEQRELFPGAQPPNGVVSPGKAPAGISPVTAMLIAAPVILFAVLFLIYRHLLNGLVLPDL